MGRRKRDFSHLRAYPGESFDFERFPPRSPERTLQDAAAASLLQSMGLRRSPPRSPRKKQRNTPSSPPPRFTSLLSLVHFLVRRIDRGGRHRGTLVMMKRTSGRTDRIVQVELVMENGYLTVNVDGEPLTTFQIGGDAISWFLTLPMLLNDADLVVAGLK